MDLGEVMMRFCLFSFLMVVFTFAWLPGWSPILGTSAAFAQVADNMTCQQAVAYYERNGRISKITTGNTTIPIYGGVPVSRRSTLRCSTSSVYLKTLDNPRCTIAYKCAPFFGGR